MRALATHPAARGLEDDAAVLNVGDQTLVLTHDALAEGVHFLPGQDMADVAWKLVAVNLSDLAAKGATPIGVLLSYAMGDDDERFADGLGRVLSQYEVALLGGDTIAAKGPKTLGLTAIGRATHTPVPGRHGANAGDRVYVTGVIGKAMLGLEQLASGGPHMSAYCRPEPLLTEGAALAPVATAMMDVSDGLLLDAWRMAKASNVTIRLNSEAVPVAAPDRRDECLRWGDDYQLLFTLAPDVICPVPATPIGLVEKRNGAALWVDNAAVTPRDGLGYEH